MIVQFAPTTRIPFPDLDKEYGTVKFVLPTAGRHLVLPGINLDERSRSDEWIKCVVLQPDVSAEGMLKIYLLQECNWDFAPSFKHARNQVRPRKFHILAELYRKLDRLPRSLDRRSNQMGMRQADRPLFPDDIENVDSEKSYDFKITALINETQTVELVDVGSKLPVLNVREPAVGNIVIMVVLLFRNLEAQRLHVAGRQADAQTLGSEPLPCFRVLRRLEHRRRHGTAEFPCRVRKGTGVKKNDRKQTKRFAIPDEGVHILINFQKQMIAFLFGGPDSGQKQERAEPTGYLTKDWQSRMVSY